MDSSSFIRQQFDDSVRALQAARGALVAPLQRAAALCCEALRSGGKIMACGNGGSAADAQHLAAEIVGRFLVDRPAGAALALNTDTSALTAIGNDYGFESVFARQVEGLAGAGDVLVAISTSGNSANVVAAARSARRLGCAVVGLTGDGGGELADLADVLVAAPSQHVPRIQEVHSLCVHVLAALVEQEVLAVGSAGVTDDPADAGGSELHGGP